LASNELIRIIINRLNQIKIIILLGGVALGILMYLFAKNTPVIFSVKSTLYPLTAANDAGSASSKLTELIGGGGSSKTLSDDANVKNP
jgi:hypothetical protein